jgi:hypothetical protein
MQLRKKLIGGRDRLRRRRGWRRGDSHGARRRGGYRYRHRQLTPLTPSSGPRRDGEALSIEAEEAALLPVTS